MAFAADYAVLFDRLDEELRVAPQLDRSLFTKIIVGACRRMPVMSNPGGCGYFNSAFMRKPAVPSRIFMRSGSTLARCWHRRESRQS